MIPKSNQSNITTWIIASSNQGKINEFNLLLATQNIILKPQSDFGILDAPETASTFIENALIKARHACAQTQLPCIADDSGLVVPALNGEPGLYSARYAGTKNSQDNINKLLDNLKKLPLDKQDPIPIYDAFFYCSIVLLKHPTDPTPVIAEGRWHGQITFDQRGSNGFGYDSVFYDPRTGLTAAQMPAEEKHLYSHRAQALQNLLNSIKQGL